MNLIDKVNFEIGNTIVEPDYEDTIIYMYIGNDKFLVNVSADLIGMPSDKKIIFTIRRSPNNPYAEPLTVPDSLKQYDSIITALNNAINGDTTISCDKTVDSCEIINTLPNGSIFVTLDDDDILDIYVKLDTNVCFRFASLDEQALRIEDKDAVLEGITFHNNPLEAMKELAEEE